MTAIKISIKYLKAATLELWSINKLQCMFSIIYQTKKNTNTFVL